MRPVRMMQTVRIKRCDFRIIIPGKQVARFNAVAKPCGVGCVTTTDINRPHRVATKQRLSLGTAPASQSLDMPGCLIVQRPERRIVGARVRRIVQMAEISHGHVGCGLWFACMGHVLKRHQVA